MVGRSSRLPTTVKRSVAYVSKRVRLFEDPQLREAVAEKGLPVSTAEVLLAVDANERGPIIARALAERWDQLGAREALRSVGSAIGDDVSEAESAILESDDGQVVLEWLVHLLVGQANRGPRVVREVLLARCVVSMSC